MIIHSAIQDNDPPVPKVPTIQNWKHTQNSQANPQGPSVPPTLVQQPPPTLLRQSSASHRSDMQSLPRASAERPGSSQVPPSRQPSLVCDYLHHMI